MLRHSNKVPILNPLDDVTLLKNSPVQTVVLSGINSGDTNELQALQVVATSDNPALITNPTVSYTSPNSTGVLAYQSIFGLTGKAVITVTVKDDGGVLNGGLDTFSRQFTVTVLPFAQCSELKMSNGLVAYYPFNGNVNDESGNNNRGTNYGAKPSIDRFGFAKSAMYFDGKSAIRLGSLVASIDYLTFSAWVKTSNRFFEYFGIVSKPRLGEGTGARMGFFGEGFYIGFNNDYVNFKARENSSRLDGKWHHVVVANSRTNSVLYVNGEMQNQVVYPLNPLGGLSSEGILIGKDTGSLSFFDGYIDDVRIYDRPLSSLEIKCLYNNEMQMGFPINRPPTLGVLMDLAITRDEPIQAVQLSGIGSGAVDEIQGLTVTATSDNPALIYNPTVTYTSPNVTGTLSYQPAAGVTGKATITVTVKDNGGVLNGGQDTFSRQFTVTVSPINPCSDLNLTNGLVAYYPFNGNAKDESGSSEPPNAGEPSNHKFDGNLTFTDINGTLGFASSWMEKPSWAVPDNQLEFTFSFWFNQTNYPAAGNSSWEIDNSSFGRGFGPEGFRIYSLRNQINDVLAVNKIRFGVGNEWAINNLQPNQGWSWIETELSDQQQGWHHIVAAYSAKGVQTLYVDGVLVGRMVGVKLSRIDNADGNNLTLGGRGGVQISEVRYYSKALADCEVTALHEFETKQQINRAPTLNALADVELLQNAAGETVNLSGVGSGAVDEVQALTVIATSDSPGLIPNPTVTYTSPNATGMLTYQPIIGATGKATITVTVKDDGGVLNGGQDTFSRQFTVIVSPINHAPTLNALAAVKLLQNAAGQTVNLSGIGSGSVDEVQTLTVTAVSDNSELISPSVTYTSPNGIGTLTYQPVAGVTGKATITVTVKDDGGVLNGGQDTFSRQFTVTVSPINRAPTLTALADVKLLQNAPSQMVNLSGIGSGAVDEFQGLTVTATSDNPALIAKPTVTYTNPNATGTFTYQPVAGGTGKATITVTVKDDGGVLNGGQDTFSRQFTVTVSPINRAPTLNALADVKLLQNAAGQTVNLSGIGSGSVDEVQGLTVTATSDNPALIANPSVTYTSPNATGTLIYKPIVGATGKATITVTVKDDGGVLNGGLDTFSRQFTVTVSPINRAPTLNALDDVKLLQNAPSQTVNLSGIGSGAVDEVQGLTVTATSDNPAVIANPSVTYTSANATGLLTYKPVAGATGKATITVTVKDDGGVLNGGQDTFSRQFTVTVTKTENKAPEVEIVSPQDGTTTTADVPITLVAEATDSDGTISKVEFYQNSNQQIGTISSSPYQLVVGNLNEGKYTFYAKATDNSGLSGVSKPIIINVLGERRDVAVIKVSTDENIDTLTKYVSEVQLSTHQDSLTWRSFETSEISYEVLSQYRVVIWNNPNPVRGVSTSEVQILKRLIDSGIPIYLIGPNIATSADTLGLSEKRDWAIISSLLPTGNKTQLVNVELQRQDDHGPILDGFYGRVVSFAAADMIDQCHSITNADTLAVTIDGVVLVSYPTISKPEDGETRRFSQMLPVIGKGDAMSIEERQLIFKNALCWLIDCNRCPVVNLAILADESITQPAQSSIGQPFKLKAHITTQNAECPATGIRAVAEFNGQATILDAHTEQGTVSISGGKVYFSFGRIGVHKSVSIEISLIFNGSGDITNKITAFYNGMTSKSVIEFPQVFVVSVLPSLAPTITADRDVTGNVRLRVGGQTGITYVIEKSTAIAENSPLQWSALKEIELAAPELMHIHVIEASTSSMMFRVRKK